MKSKHHEWRKILVNLLRYFLMKLVYRCKYKMLNFLKKTRRLFTFHKYNEFTLLLLDVAEFLLWSIYEIIHICTAVVDEVKSDHRSKFSNLSNWKEEAWKNQGFNGIRTRVRIPLKPWFFQASSFQLLKLENLLRWSLFTSSTTAVQIWIISYILHITSLHGKICTQ